MNKSQFSASSRTRRFRHMVAVSVLLAVAGCSGPSLEDSVVDDTHTPIPGSETGTARTVAPLTQDVTPSNTEQSRAAQVEPPPIEPQATAPNDGMPAAPTTQLGAPSFPPPDLEGTASSPNQLSGTPLDQAGTALEPAPPLMMTVPEGSVISVLLIDALSTSVNQAGDEFLASLAEPIVVGGRVVVDEGVNVRGRVVDVSEAGRVQGRARIQLVLTHILPLGDPIAISTRPFMDEAETDLGRDARLGGIGAVVGGAIGALTGGRRGAAIGAVAGGAGTVAATRGNQLEYAAESGLVFELDQAVKLPRIRPSQLSTGERLDF